VICNAETGTQRVQKTLDATSLAAATPVLVATATMSIDLEFGLCSRHLARRRMPVIGAALAAVAAVAAGAVLDVLFVSFGVVLLLALAVVLARRYELPRLTHIDAVQARVKVGRPFAGSFATDLG
jgi:hypothetical protein